ncbi:MAG: hypothetical protein IT555_03870 [Acetobacteraceae bacterium]|nr:hypothetical protein [Acetobacteraceae bacterium]
MAGLPELDEVFQAGEQAGEAGHDEGVQGVGQPAGRVIPGRGDAQAGDVFGQVGVGD